MNIESWQTWKGIMSLALLTLAFSAGYKVAALLGSAL